MFSVVLVSESVRFAESFSAKVSTMGYRCLSWEEVQPREIDAEAAILVIDLESSRMSFKELEEMMGSIPSAVLILSAIPLFEEGYPLLRLGVKGYANKHIGTLHLENVLQVLSSGGTWYDPGFMNDLIRRVDVRDSAFEKHSGIGGEFSEREEEIARYVAQGLSNRQIAEQLDITERTVKAHLLSCYRKIGVNDRVSLALWVKEGRHA